MKKLIYIIVGCFILSANLYASKLRNYMPLIIIADSIDAFKDAPNDKLFLFSYNASNTSWEIIPFQIDEVDTSVRPEEKYFGNNDGLFNAADELVFLSNSLGDQAPADNWVSGTDSIRVELAFTDPLSQQQGYVYLYHSNQEGFTVPDPYHMTYHSETDQIETLHYRTGFNNTGQMGDIYFRQAIGGNDADVFDRVKIRFYLSFFSFSLTANEDSIIYDHAYAKTGPVRIIRNMVATFVYRPFFSGESFIQTSFFYPWHGEFKLFDIPIGDLTGFPFVEIDEFRLSWDMNSNAAGMKLFSANNLSGVTIDGNQNNDSFDSSCQPGKLNWTFLSGDQGNLLNIFYIPTLGDSIRLYYHDATDSSTGDRQPLFAYDTGDQMSYGDNGFSLIGNLEFYITPETTFDFLYYNFFLGNHFTTDSAAILTQQLENPLKFAANVQMYMPTAVPKEDPASAVKKFKLFQNYPNPFNSSTNIEFTLPQPSSVKIAIFDISGREVKILLNQRLPRGNFRFTWDGTNQSGQSLSTGVYFCRLTSEAGTAIQKMMLIR